VTASAMVSPEVWLAILGLFTGTLVRMDPCVFSWLMTTR
jgi:hypothetical protein